MKTGEGVSHEEGDSLMREGGLWSDREVTGEETVDTLATLLTQSIQRWHELLPTESFNEEIVKELRPKVEQARGIVQSAKAEALAGFEDDFDNCQSWSDWSQCLEKRTSVILRTSHSVLALFIDSEDSSSELLRHYVTFAEEENLMLQYMKRILEITDPENNIPSFISSVNHNFRNQLRPIHQPIDRFNVGRQFTSFINYQRGLTAERVAEIEGKNPWNRARIDYRDQLLENQIHINESFDEIDDEILEILRSYDCAIDISLQLTYFAKHASEVTQILSSGFELGDMTTSFTRIDHGGFYDAESIPWLCSNYQAGLFARLAEDPNASITLPEQTKKPE